MQVIECLNNGLKRKLQIIVSKNDLNYQFNKKLKELKNKIILNGFRSGKVPIGYLKKLYGKSTMLETIKEFITIKSKIALKKRQEKPAYQPEVIFSDTEENIKNILTGNFDLKFDIIYEILPLFKIPDFKKIKIKKITAIIKDEDINNTIYNISEKYQDYKLKTKNEKSELNDKIEINFIGKINGKTFKNSSANNVSIKLGSKSFILDFEDKLIGVKIGDNIKVKIKFSKNHLIKSLKNKTAIFDITINKIFKINKILKINDSFAQKLGVKNIIELRNRIKDEMYKNLNKISYQKIKYTLLNELEKIITFQVPEKLFLQEFNSIKTELKKEIKYSDKNNTIKEETINEYEVIAKRRVRLGLLFSQIGDHQEIKISDKEVNQFIMNKINENPNKKEQIIKYYEKNIQAINQIHSILFEEKIINYILKLITISEEVISYKELIINN